MPRGLSQERAQRIWDAAYGASFVYLRERRPWTLDEVVKYARDRASEAVTALRERERRQPKGRR